MVELSQCWFVNDAGLNYNGFYAIGSFENVFHTCAEDYFFGCWVAPDETLLNNRKVAQ